MLPPTTPEETPRTTHVLRPHHIAILSVFILVLREPPSPTFNLHIWRVLAREIAETRPPRSFEQLIQTIISGPYEYADENIKMGRGLRNVPKHLYTHDGMSQFFADVIAFVPERDDEAGRSVLAGNYAVERRSYFGLFIRRCYLSFFKLSWRGSIKLLADYKNWVEGKETGYNLRPTDRDGGLLLVPTLSDEQNQAQMDPYERYENAVKVGDVHSAIENLRRFFDQQFSQTDESGLTQHALLNLARLHYSLGEFQAAGSAAEEALKLARNANDALTALHCNKHRLIPASSSPGSNISATVKPNTPPLEVLYEVQKGIATGDSLRAAFRRLYQSIGCGDASYADSTEAKWARHAAQATLWTYAGVESLAQTHENIVIAFTGAGDDDSRLNALRAKARRMVRQGNCGGALMVLLDPETWRGLTLRQYGFWASDVWKALFETAKRRRQESLISDVLIPRRPGHAPLPQALAHRMDFPHKHNEVVAEKIARRLMDDKEYAQALTHILDALWSSEYRGTWTYHRLAVVQLAEVSTEFGMAARGRRIIEGCLPQILNGDDIEIRAYACHTLARCIIAESWSQDDPKAKPPPAKQVAALEEAIPFLQVAETDYNQIGVYTERLHVIYTLSVVHHNIALGLQAMVADGDETMVTPDTSVEWGTDRAALEAKAKQMMNERDRMAEMYMEVDKMRKEVSSMGADEELKAVLDTVVKVGAAINRVPP
ncbi:hypothetical protein M407DRAFT_23283 [Tulasnella calospora MUT 4182]|uniref:Anaphase-promoting complex subunit 5 n=1 Tax=Tulasnella calospora MUT 4182 TaxID=1051891 RepID=A0A0C3L177_9AGAM|nr:hypothetical protein M407DRAFT_23283 [Tulasnella calospora MUT 4182]